MRLQKYNLFLYAQQKFSNFYFGCWLLAIGCQRPKAKVVLLVKQMSEQEIVNLCEQVHSAFTIAVFLVSAIDAVVLVRINHKVELYAVGNHRLDELHRILIVHVVVARAMAKQVVTFDHSCVAHW